MFDRESLFILCLKLFRLLIRAEANEGARGRSTRSGEHLSENVTLLSEFLFKWLVLEDLMRNNASKHEFVALKHKFQQKLLNLWHFFD